MGTPFRLIDLPSIALRKIFFQMSVPHLYFLTTLRRDVSDVIASLKIRMQGIDVRITDRRFHIAFYGLLLYDSFHTWDFSSENVNRPNTVPYLTGFSRDVDYGILYGQKSRFGEEARKILAHLTKMFHFPTIHLALEMKHFDLFDAAFHEINFEEPVGLELDGGKCSAEHISTLKSIFKTVSSFHTSSYMEADVESRKWLVNTPNLFVKTPYDHRMREGWFTAGELMSSTCTEAHIKSHTLTEHDVNQFIRKWIDNQSPQLRKMFIDFNRQVRQEEVMRDLDLRPFDPIRFPSHRTVEERMGVKPDLYESNGRFVTILCSSSVKFYFWNHDEFYPQ